eukprot:Pgem_evm1s13247
MEATKMSAKIPTRAEKLFSVATDLPTKFFIQLVDNELVRINEICCKDPFE